MASSLAGSLTTKSRHSIERRLPLLIGALLLLVVAVFTVATYVEVRQNTIRVATRRLTDLAEDFRSIFGQSAAQLRARMAPLSTNGDVRAFAANRDARTRARALAVLRDIPQPDQVIASEIRSESGEVLLTTAPGNAALALDVADVLPATEPADSGLVGRFRLLRDSLVYPVAVPIRGADAYVVQWRRLGGSARGREQINDLIGQGRALFLGNADGSAWSNLERVHGDLPVNRAVLGQVQVYARDGQPHLASAATVPGTPWMVVVEIPRARVMAPVNAFLRRIVAIALVALALGVLVAWRLSRNITAPLRQLTTAAQAMSAGHYDQRVDLKRTDEFRVLGDAFTTMAERVRESREHLEHEVEHRTRDLNDALIELHHAQDALVRRERLALLGQLASGVGHELRNPLGVMTNAVYYLRTVLKGSTQDVHEYLDIIQQQVTLSEKIVADLLDFARSRTPQRSPAALAGIVDAQVARLAAPATVRVRVEVPAELPDVLVDPVQAGQIVLNLLTNALQAVGSSGEITVRAARVDDAVECSVADTGAGIDPRNLGRIFEPLFTTKARGIGLGLAVSRTLARANGGDLTVDAAGGPGATFRLRLPVAAARLADAARPLQVIT